MPDKTTLGGQFLRRAEALAESLRQRDPVGALSHLPSERLNLLFVCSRNQWRSPTAEQVWRRDPRVNTRSAGTATSARRVVSEADLAWADVVLVMEDKHKSRLLSEHRALLQHKPLYVLDIPDDYRYMDPELVALLGAPVAALLGLDQ